MFKIRETFSLGGLAQTVQQVHKLV